MPRQIDLFSHNLQVNHDPTQQLGLTAGQVNGLQAQIPVALEKASIAFINSVLEAIDEATGWDLLSFAQQVEAGLGTTGNFATDLWNYIFKSGSNWTTVLEELGIPDQTATALVTWLQELLTPNSPLNAGNLWGLIDPKWLTQIPTWAISSAPVNPLFNPNFEGSISVSAGGGWSWDPAVYYTPAGSTPGSVKVVADGTVHGLRSNFINIDANQILQVSMPILSSGLSVTGTPLELAIITFDGTTQTGITTLTSMGAPSGVTTGWTGAPGGSHATTITANYTCPSSGVTQVQLRLVVDTGATAGTVWWGNATASISGGVIDAIQTDLSSLSADSAASTAALSTLFSSWESAITGYTTWTSFIAAMESAWQTYVTTETTLTAGAFATIQQLINTLLGINTSTGQMNGSNVGNILGGASLADDVQAILDYIANALGHSGTGHTLTQIETYLGLIPPANVQSSTGASNLQSDINAVFTPFTSVNGLTSTTAWQDSWNGLMDLLGVGTHNLSTPVTPTSLGVTGSTSGGSFAAGTYYWVVTAVLSTGETGKSNEVNAALTGTTSSAALSWTGVTGATGYKVYRGTATGAENHLIASPTGTSYTDTGTAGSVAAPPNPQPASQVPAISDTWTQLYGSPALNNITTIEQDIINFVQNAISGGNASTSSNSPATAIFDALLNIPHGNVVIPPSPGSGSITHDANASATPYTGSINNFVSLTWNHTCGANANYLIVRMMYYAQSAVVINVSCGGTTMQRLVSEPASDGWTNLGIFALTNPPTGSALSMSVTVYAPFGNYIRVVAAESDSYVGVGSVGTASANNGANGSPSLSASSASGDYIVQAFAASALTGGSTPLTSYNRTQQYNSGAISGFNVGAALLAGDAAGASSVSFTATSANTTSDYWTAAAVDLIPLSAATIGSGFRAANTSTTNVAAAAATTNELFPNSFFNSTTAQPIGADFVASGYSTTGNTLTVGHAGWYTVTIAVLISATVSNQYLGLLLYQTPSGGSAIIKRGNHQYVYNPLASANYVVSHTFQVYCNAKDTLQPGYFVSTTGNWFVGTTDGLSTYFEVSLNNRSLM